MGCELNENPGRCQVRDCDRPLTRICPGIFGSIIQLRPDIAIAEGETVVQPDAVADDGSWEAVAVVQICHALQSAMAGLPST